MVALLRTNCLNCEWIWTRRRSFLSYNFILHDIFGFILDKTNITLSIWTVRPFSSSQPSYHNILIVIIYSQAKMMLLLIFVIPLRSAYMPKSLSVNLDTARISWTVIWNQKVISDNHYQHFEENLLDCTACDRSYQTLQPFRMIAKFGGISFAMNIEHLNTQK